MTITNYRTVAVFVSAVVLFATQNSFAQSSDEKSTSAKDRNEVSAEKVQIKRWQEYYVQTASEYKMILSEDLKNPLTLRTKPIFQYSNSVRTGGQHGAIHLWLKNNRPQVVGSIWSTRNREDSTKRNVAHEFQSLSEIPLTASRHGKTIWESPQAGVHFQPVPNAGKPVKSKSLRFSQMRKLARNFSAQIDKSKAEEGRELRLLPQPVYRYQSDSDGVLEGGLFAFVMGTDPELFLLIEARKTENGPIWSFAAARFTYVPLSLRYKDVSIWRCESSRQFSYKSGYPYFLYWQMEIRDAIIQ